MDRPTPRVVSLTHTLFTAVTLPVDYFNLLTRPLNVLLEIRQVALGPCITVLHLSPLPRLWQVPTLKARALSTPP